MRAFELIEDTKKFDIDEKNLPQYLQQHCPIALKRARQGHFIYRGRKDRENKILLHKPYKSNRVSYNIDLNYYNLLLSNLDNWEEFPKRNQSLIGTTSATEAKENYGNPFVVFPFDNPKIGVCSSSDLWKSFPYLFKNVRLTAPGIGRPDPTMEMFNEHFHEFLHLCKGRELSNDVDKSFSKLKKLFNLIKKSWQQKRKTIEKIFNSKDPQDKPIQDLFKIVFEKYNGDIELAMLDLLDPKKNGFELLRLSEFNIQGNREVWLQGPCVLVELDVFFDNEDAILEL